MDNGHASAANEHELLAPPQAAAILKMSPLTLQQWRAAKYGPPFIRLSKRAVRYRRSDIEQWLRQQQAA